VANFKAGRKEETTYIGQAWFLRAKAATAFSAS